MSVYKPKQSKVWQFDFVVQGRRYHGSTGQHTQRAAEAVERKKRQDAALGRLSDGSQMSLDVAADRWWMERGAALSDAADVQVRLGRLAELIGPNMRLSEIDQECVARAIETRRGTAFRRSSAKGAKEYLPANATVNRDVIGTLRPVLKRAATHWGAKGLPEIDWRELHLSEPRETVRVYSDGEQDRWIDEARRTGWYDGRTPREDAADVSLAVELILTYGLRLGELFFPPSAYDPSGPRLAWTKGRKGDVPHVVPLLEEHATQIAILVGRALAANLEHIWFWEGRPDSKGQRKLISIEPGGLSTRINNAAERAGIAPGRRIHGARHHAGTMTYRETGDIKAVQGLLGHLDLKSTNRYVHAGESKVRASLEARAKSRNSPEAQATEKKKA